MAKGFRETKTKYPGVTFIEGTTRGTGKTRKIFYIGYYIGTKRIHEKATQNEGTEENPVYVDCRTAAEANKVRTKKMDRDELPNTERRVADERAKTEAEGRWTISKLWGEYLTQHGDLKGKATDENRYELYLKDAFGAKEPGELVALDVDRLRVNLGKTREPATVRNVLELLRRIVNFGIKRGLCPPLSFRIAMPRVNNMKTEDLTAEQMATLLKILREGSCKDKDGKTVHFDEDARDIMTCALATGLRRGEIFRLTWDDLDYGRGFIAIRGPKGGSDMVIPMPDAARAIFHRRSRTASPYVFPGRTVKDEDGKVTHRQRVDIRKTVNAIKAAAGLPKDFRPVHGLSARLRIHAGIERRCGPIHPAKTSDA